MSIKPFQQCPFNLMVKCNYEYPCIGCEKLTKESKVIAPSASNNNRSDEIAWVEQAFDCYIRGMSDDYYKNIWNEHKNAVVAQLRVMR